MTLAWKSIFIGFVIAERTLIYRIHENPHFRQAGPCLSIDTYRFINKSNIQRHQEMHIHMY